MNIPDVTPFISLPEATVQIALSQLGVHEQGGNNTGPEVDEYIRFVGLDPPEPWCASFLCWCIGQAAKQLNIQHQFQFGASVYKLWTRNQGLIIPNFEPNCIILKNEGNNSAGHPVGHALFGISLNDDGTYKCISGNTNAAGSREGNCVAINNRSPDELKLGYGFLRIQ